MKNVFETLRVLLYGKQPIAKINEKTLERIIQREFGNHKDEVKYKLNKIRGNTPEGIRRLSAATIKLANKDVHTIDNLIQEGNNDFRDILIKAEYPRCFNLSFSAKEKTKMKPIYIQDWKDYLNWLYKR